MAIENYFERLKRIDSLIRRQATGTPEELASKLGIAKRTLFEYLQFIKQEGAEFEYSRTRQSYYYTRKGSFKVGFQFEELSKDESNTGGGRIVPYYGHMSLFDTMPIVWIHQC